MVREALQQEFEAFGITVSDEVLDKCVTICMCSNIPAEEFVETWMAYSLSNLNGADPTIEYINQFERKELKGYTSQNQTKKSSSKTATTPIIYNKSEANVSSRVESNSDSVLDVYATTPKGKTAQKRLADTSPIGHLDKKNASHCGSPSIYTPASFTPDIFSPNSNYSKRTNSGQIVASFGAKEIFLGKSQVSNVVAKSSVSIVPYGGAAQISAKTLFMYETLVDKAAVLDSTVSYLGELLLKKHGLPPAGNHCKGSQTEITAVGRIVCDTSDGKLNAASILLEGDEATCTGRSIPLKLPESGVAVFPGQVVAVQGSNPSRNQFIASKLYTDVTLPLPETKPRLDSNTGSLSIFVSAGPYTQSDTLSYKPLEDLIALTVQQEPDILILIGPLLDANHPLLLNGSLAETFEDFYIKLIDSIVQPLEKVKTQVIIVASYREATSPCRYPTPPPFCTTGLKRSKVTFIADPSTVDISGVVLGVTSVDVLMHLGREEFAVAPTMSDRLSRLASHLIQQQSYYPLMPPNIELPVDMECWELYAQLPVTPHIMILPSDLRYFVKNLSGCVVINPERLSKGMVGGSFAKIEVKPVDNNMIWSTSTHVNVQVVKI
uniref:DNA polymerase alpha subunit B n=2 Tax=Cacopsylla melanoneura TaxID=428564 RepID=A0A8D8YYD0_9HEMI